MPVGITIFLVLVLLVVVAVLINAFRSSPVVRPQRQIVRLPDIAPAETLPAVVEPTQTITPAESAIPKSAGLIEAERRAAEGVISIQEGMMGAGLGPSDASLIQNRQVDFASLGRQATAAKKSGNLLKAVDLLLEQRRIAADAGFTPSVKTLLRLPLYLQAAGLFSEAEEEFERLLAKADLAYMDQGGASCSPARKLYAAALWRAEVYDKMRLAYERQGDAERADEYAGLHRDEVEAGFAIRSVIDLESEEESARIKERLARIKLTGRP